MPFLMQPSPFILALDQHFTYALACASQVTVERTRQCLAQRYFDVFRGGDRTANPVISRLRLALRVSKSAPPLTNTIQIIKVIHLIFLLQVFSFKLYIWKQRQERTVVVASEICWGPLELMNRRRVYSENTAGRHPSNRIAWGFVRHYIYQTSQMTESFGMRITQRGLQPRACQQL